MPVQILEVLCTNRVQCWCDADVSNAPKKFDTHVNRIWQLRHKTDTFEEMPDYDVFCIDARKSHSTCESHWCRSISGCYSCAFSRRCLKFLLGLRAMCVLTELFPEGTEELCLPFQAVYYLCSILVLLVAPKHCTLLLLQAVPLDFITKSPVSLSDEFGTTQGMINV